MIIYVNAIVNKVLLEISIISKRPSFIAFSITSLRGGIASLFCKFALLVIRRTAKVAKAFKAYCVYKINVY